MRWVARIIVFTAALGFGTGAAWLLGIAVSGVDTEAVVVRQVNKFTAKDLPGTWTGHWGRNSGDCTIEIEEVRGNKFYGTLSKEGAEITFEGIFDPVRREVFFQETEVVTLGPDMSEWSLGTNRGSVSDDGHVMFGTGEDEWGSYAWAASSFACMR